MSGDDERFVREHDDFVRIMAHRLMREFDLRLDVKDLIGFGVTGLLEARSRYDASRGVPFQAYASYRVRGAMLDGVRKMAYLPSHVHAARKAAEAASEMLEQMGEERAASPEQRADLEATLGAIDDVLTKVSAAFVISCVGQDEEQPRTSPEDALLGQEATRRVREAVAALPEREAKVIRGFYLEGRPLDDVAKSIGVSKSWASRIHTRALGMMRASLERTE